MLNGAWRSVGEARAAIRSVSAELLAAERYPGLRHPTRLKRLGSSQIRRSSRLMTNLHAAAPPGAYGGRRNGEDNYGACGSRRRTSRTGLHFGPTCRYAVAPYPVIGLPGSFCSLAVAAAWRCTARWSG